VAYWRDATTVALCINLQSVHGCEGIAHAFPDRRTGRGKHVHHPVDCALEVDSTVAASARISGPAADEWTPRTLPDSSSETTLMNLHERSKWRALLLPTKGNLPAFTL